MSMTFQALLKGYVSESCMLFVGLAIWVFSLGSVLNVFVIGGRSRVQVPGGAQNILLFYDFSSFFIL